MKIQFTKSPKWDEYQQTTMWVTPFIQVWRDGKRYKQWSIIVGWLFWYISFNFGYA